MHSTLRLQFPIFISSGLVPRRGGIEQSQKKAYPNAHIAERHFETLRDTN